MNAHSVTASAPGKLMLLGEHAVVYGRPCIVTAVDQRMRATVERIDNPSFILHAPDVGLEEYHLALADITNAEIPKGARFLVEALQQFRVAHPFDGGIRVRTSSDFSSHFGFGSSSASTIAFLRAIDACIGTHLDLRTLFELAFAVVLAVQKTGSGFDVAAATWGGTLHYARGGEIATALPNHSFSLVVGYTGVKVETAPVVHRIREESLRDGGRIERLYDAMATVTAKGVTAFSHADWPAFGVLMDEQQALLRDLGVSSDVLERCILAAKQAGALGAKLSGTGIGDCMIALGTPETVPAIMDAITAAGGIILPVRVQAPAVRLE